MDHQSLAFSNLTLTKALQGELVDFPSGQMASAATHRRQGRACMLHCGEVTVSTRLKERVTIEDLADDENAACEREPTVVVVGVLLLGAPVLICFELIVPILWTVMTEDGRPIFTYQQCGTVKDEARRLACYDDVYLQLLQNRAH
jgi:hypothetical protein